MAFLKKISFKSLKMARPHNFGSVLRTFLRFCTMKGTKRYMEIFVTVFLKKFSIGENGTALKVFVFGVIVVRIFPAFSRIWTEYREIRIISPYSVRMRKNAGKMQTRITPNSDTFYAMWVRSDPKMVRSHNSESILRIFFKLCTMKGPRDTWNLQ